MLRICKVLILFFCVVSFFKQVEASSYPHAYSVPGYRIGQGEISPIAANKTVSAANISPDIDDIFSQCNPVEIDGIPPYRAFVVPLSGKFYVSKIEASWIPPDPGESGKIRILGVDSDGDCLRDDLERFIVNLAPSANQKQLRKYLFKYGQLRTHFLLSQQSGFNTDYAKEFSREIYVASECVHNIVNDKIKSKELLRKVFSQTHNTYSRSVNYINNNSLLGGWSDRNEITVSCP